MPTDSMDKPTCRRCRLPECVCPPGGALPARTEIIVVRHFVERHKMSGTARLIPLAIAGAQVVDVGGPKSAARNQIAPQQPERTYVLFPGGKPISAVATRIRRLVVPDGTWAQARRMRTRVPMLAKLPAVSLAAGRAALRLRDPRNPEELPTAEALARALEALGDGDCGALLRRLFVQMHEQLTRGSRRRPSLN